MWEETSLLIFYETWLRDDWWHKDVEDISYEVLNGGGINIDADDDRLILNWRNYRGICYV